MHVNVTLPRAARLGTRLGCGSNPKIWGGSNAPIQKEAPIPKSGVQSKKKLLQSKIWCESDPKFGGESNPKSRDGSKQKMRWLQSKTTPYPHGSTPLGGHPLGKIHVLILALITSHTYHVHCMMMNSSNSWIISMQLSLTVSSSATW